VQLANTGASPATGVQAVLSVLDDYVTVIDSTESFGDIAPAARPGARAATSSACGATARRPSHPLGLDISAGSFQARALVEIEVQGADLVPAGTVVYGDPGGILDPGETRSLGVRLLNRGQIPATQVSATLVSLSPRVTVLDSLGSFSTIDPGMTRENLLNPFRVTRAPRPTRATSPASRSSCGTPAAWPTPSSSA